MALVSEPQEVTVWAQEIKWCTDLTGTKWDKWDKETLEGVRAWRCGGF